MKKTLTLALALLCSAAFAQSVSIQGNTGAVIHGNSVGGNLVCNNNVCTDTGANQPSVTSQGYGGGVNVGGGSWSRASSTNYQGGTMNIACDDRGCINTDTGERYASPAAAGVPGYVLPNTGMLQHHTLQSNSSGHSTGYGQVTATTGGYQSSVGAAKHARVTKVTPSTRPQKLVVGEPVVTVMSALGQPNGVNLLIHVSPVWLEVDGKIVPGSGSGFKQVFIPTTDGPGYPYNEGVLTYPGTRK